ncbi:MAG: ATP synthase subunit I [Bacillota bacterium]|uniref:ATP synthase subunit I n=1 Tax=Virgibacillus salarius TaxID=447199 RepID=A0A941DRD7_9BACI|nr:MULTISPECIES: ATP synthase subunit I [Bacillaceae]NAZ08352.1 ATP synthase subunit I [Agaribacter marinus]MBR7795639.1 ATP synthase subunit I [Virgibacillus salarius]MCC2251304.1 ATP synthase subunit I [Virgibacillus sp. AGTR]MDY7045651.1 ATP synthase subunit I [Virgibacillus sp. M23]QRZ18529.1 ATP synthase subunit I [Virgibacillus sp. AGTR]
MSQFEKMTARQRKWMFYLLAIFVLGAGFTPYPRIFLGLLLGSIVSFYNLYLLQKKIVDFTDAAANKTPTRGIGTVSRFAAAALAIIIALRMEENFHIIAVLIGLMTSYLVIMIDFALYNIKHSSKKEG